MFVYAKNVVTFLFVFIGALRRVFGSALLIALAILLSTGSSALAARGVRPGGKFGPSGPAPTMPVTGPATPASQSASASPVATPPAPVEKADANLVKIRPRVTGEYIAEVDLKTLTGEKVALGSLLQGQFTVLIFSKPENLWFESALGYFRRVVPYLKKMGYQIIVVTPDDYDYIQDIGKRVKAGGSTNGILIDESRKSFMAMGLTDTAVKDGPSINAIFLVSPVKQIMFQFASVSDLIPFSGEVLVLAARVYKDAFQTDSSLVPATKMVTSKIEKSVEKPTEKVEGKK